MLPRFLRTVTAVSTLIASAVSIAFAQDYSHRQSLCTLTVKPGAEVKVKQLRNHFAFGGSINYWAFDTLVKGEKGVTQNYGDMFLQYFDYATPENEMKWDEVQWGDEENDPNWERADVITKFCKENDITVRGHNLFWNEDTVWIPPWAYALPKTEFKAAMKRRIESAMEYSQEKGIVHWDVINEIIHGYKSPGVGGAKPSLENLTLVKYSGDNNIFDWILTEARKLAPDTKFTINDYGLEGSDQDGTDYINRCKPFKDKFDIVGIEGHFGGSVFNSNDLNRRINKLASELENEVWLTEVDWTYNVSQSPSKMEELMKLCFTNENVGGLILWTWADRKKWREGLSNVLVDSLGKETATGAKWKEIREGFKTNTSGTADDKGKFTFKGFQGKYQVLVGSDTMIVYLHPGNKTTILKDIVSVKPYNMRSASQIRINGKTVTLPAELDGNKSLYIATYSVSGKLISKIPLNFNNGTASINKLPSGCHIYRICSGDNTHYTGMAVKLK